MADRERYKTEITVGILKGTWKQKSQEERLRSQDTKEKKERTG